MTLPRFMLDLLALPPEASSVARDVDALHATIIGTSIAGAIGVALLVTRYVIRHRRRSPNETTPRVEASTAGEIAIAGSTLALFVAFWVVGFRQYLFERTPPADATVVYVTAKQWMWKFGYGDGRSSNDDLVVEVGKPVKLVMTSRDVIHSFYVPAFRLKQDVLPGRYVTLWFQPTEVGSFDIFCAEYCGTLHSNMHGTVHVVAAGDLARELDAHVEGSTGADLAQEGAAVAARWQCSGCHPHDARTSAGPSWAGLYGSYQTLEDGRRVLADDDYLERSILDPNAERVAGYSTVMPSYRNLLTPQETAALVAYLRTFRSKTP